MRRSPRCPPGLGVRKVAASEGGGGASLLHCVLAHRRERHGADPREVASSPRGMPEHPAPGPETLGESRVSRSLAESRRVRSSHFPARIRVHLVHEAEARERLLAGCAVHVSCSASRSGRPALRAECGPLTCSRRGGNSDGEKSTA